MMKWILVIVVILLSTTAYAGSWDIGAVQLEGSATDIGAVQESAAAPAGGQVIIISKAAVPFILVLSVILIKRRKAA